MDLQGLAQMTPNVVRNPLLSLQYETVTLPLAHSTEVVIVGDSSY